MHLQVRRCKNCQREITSAQDGEVFCDSYCRKSWFCDRDEGCSPTEYERINAKNQAENDVDQ